MANVIVNYDGSITTTPQQYVTPQNVAQLQEILRDTTNYPSPVRAKGSFHSLTPMRIIGRHHRRYVRPRASSADR